MWHLDSEIEFKCAGGISPQDILSATEQGDIEGVRGKLARFVLLLAPEIRAAARRKLTKSARTVTDSEDVLSTVLRRVDRLVTEGCFRPQSDEDIHGLVMTVARNAAISKTRLAERAKRLLREDGDYTWWLVRRSEMCRTDEDASSLLNRMMWYLSSERERQVFALRLRGASHRTIGQLLGVSETAVREQWRRMRQELQAAFEGTVDASQQ